jgi:hypothetical protein
MNMRALCWMLPVLMMGCARDHGGMELRIDGQAITIAPQSPLSDSEFVLFERAVEDGALQAETVVGEATSDAVGAFAVTFPRKSSYSLRWTAVAQDHFPAAGILDPEDLYPNEPFDLTVGLHAVCTLHVQLASIAPEDSTDNVRFNLGEDFPCDCCPTDQILLEGVGADSAWQCLMHGDQWMTWGADLDVALIGQPDGLFVDSVFCPAFGSAELNLTW